MTWNRTVHAAGGGLAVLLASVTGTLAQDAEPGAGASSLYEPGLMLLAVAGVLVAAGLIVRLLIRMKIVERLLWTFPVMAALTGAVELVLLIANLPSFPNLKALMGFLFLFLLFICTLYPAARLAMPARVRRTREGVPPLLRALAIGIVAFVGMFILLTWFFPRLNLTPMFVTSGVVSIVLGLALQELLANLMSGVVLSLEQPFKVGDWVKIGATEGELVDQSWRAVRVRTRDNDYVLIPNNTIAKESVVNFELPTSQHLVKIHVGVTYETPCGAATAALVEAASRVEEVLRSPAPHVYLKDFLDSSVLYELRVWIDNYASLHAIESGLRMEIWYAFKRHGITIPFPQRDVHLRQAATETTERVSRLVVTAGPLRGVIFPLGREKATIGRAPECTLVVSDPHVSNEHAVIEPEGDRYRLRDLGSRHGTILNGNPVTVATLDQGDEIRIDPITLVYETHFAPAGTASRIPPAPARQAATTTGEPAHPDTAT
jgi:small-conductance mechanosensitive channel